VKPEENTITAFLLDSSDNVATVLDEAPAGAQISIKGTDTVLTAADTVPSGHKIAIVHIDELDEIIKYGQRIGRAYKSIDTGSWVHLHNIESVYDAGFRERIGT